MLNNLEKVIINKFKFAGENIKVNISDIYVAFALISMSVILTILSPVFLTVTNIRNVIVQASINAVISFGMTFVIISGGIDLSVGSIVALSGVIAASFLNANPSLLYLSLLICIVIGALCGLFNGIIITKGNVPPFIATLGMMSIARGLALFYSGGKAISGFDSRFLVLGTGSLLGIPSLIIVMILVVTILYIILNYTCLGRYTYAIGGSEEATKLSGINVNKYKIIIYVISGITSSIAAIMLTARLNSAQPIAGYGYELDAIAATVIGGTSLSGGQGKIQGTMVGALIMSMLRNGLNLLNVSSYIQQFIIGLVIIVAVFIDKVGRK